MKVIEVVKKDLDIDLESSHSQIMSSSSFKDQSGSHSPDNFGGIAMREKMVM